MTEPGAVPPKVVFGSVVESDVVGAVVVGINVVGAVVGFNVVTTVEALVVEAAAGHNGDGEPTPGVAGSSKMTKILNL